MDLKLIWTEENLAALSVGEADLNTDEGLTTAVLVSLFTDRRVSADEELPPGETSRRGYWGDSFPEVQNDKIGSRLWLLNREKQLQIVIEKAREYAREAVQWLLDDRVANRVDVVVESPAFQTLLIQITIYRPSADPVNFRYNYNWQAQAVSEN